MRRIVTGTFISLDGIVDADDDWQFPYFDEQLFSVIGEGWEGSDAVLLGRRSFDGYAQLQTDHPDSPALAFLNRVDRFVVSNTITEPAMPGSTVISGGEAEQTITDLKAEAGKNILVLGSPQLTRWLLSRGLLDELNLIVLPIIVGSGPRLFEDTPFERLGLRLRSSRALDNGALVLSYEPDRS